MRPPQALPLFLALALVPSAPVAGQETAPALAAVVLSEVVPDPDSGLGEREFIELWNNGTEPVALAGWKVRDAATAAGSVNTFTFPAWTLQPNGRVVVWGGGAADGLGPAWSNPTVWNNAGDGAALIDPAGRVVDWLGYGTTASPPPEMAGRSAHAKPASGQSLQLDGSAWVVGAPSPGTVFGAVQGGITLPVANAPPVAAFGALPRATPPGSVVAIPVLPSDPNGPADVRSWSLVSGTTILGSGSSGTETQVAAIAPPAGTSWTLQLTVTDQAGLVATAAASIGLRHSDLVVEMPASGPIAFPAAAPGASELRANGTVVLRNLGETPRMPRLDVSPFTGPSTFPAEGHFWVGATGADGNTTWLAYSGPLTRLPELAPGATMSLTFLVRDLPVPLAAGSYGTTFAVVP